VVGHDHHTTIQNDLVCTILGQKTEVVQGDQSLKLTDGEQRIVVEKQGSALTVKRDRRVTVQNGDHHLTVEKGKHLTQVHGQCKTEVKKGNSELWVLQGGHLTKAEKTVRVESAAAELQLVSKGPWQAKSEAAIHLQAPEIKQEANEITISAGQKITLIVGPSTLTIDASGISISGPQLSSTAAGTHTISGALVQIN